MAHSSHVRKIFTRRTAPQCRNYVWDPRVSKLVVSENMVDAMVDQIIVYNVQVQNVMRVYIITGPFVLNYSFKESSICRMH